MVIFFIFSTLMVMKMGTVIIFVVMVVVMMMMTTTNGNAKADGRILRVPPPGPGKSSPRLGIQTGHHAPPSINFIRSISSCWDRMMPWHRSWMFVIDPRHAMGQRKERRDPRHLALAHPAEQAKSNRQRTQQWIKVGVATSIWVVTRLQADVIQPKG